MARTGRDVPGSVAEVRDPAAPGTSPWAPNS